MKDQSEGGNTRRSGRQRVPNSFYTQGINELKKAPRSTRDPSKSKSKKNKPSLDDDASYLESYMEEQRSEAVSRGPNNTWMPCRLPSTGKLMKVQFLASMPEPPDPQPKKEQPAKQLKKADDSFNLLSLFQKAIENVADDPLPPKQEVGETFGRQVLRKRESLLKQRRSEVQPDRILGIQKHSSQICIHHSTLGEVEVPVSEDELEQETLNQQLVREYSRRLEASGCLRHLSIFN